MIEGIIFILIAAIVMLVGFAICIGSIFTPAPTILLSLIGLAIGAAVFLMGVQILRSGLDDFRAGYTWRRW